MNTENVPTDVLSVDQGENADWLRGFSWDLPTRVDEFLATLHVSDDQPLRTRRRVVANFMRLRSARAMPGGLRNALGRRGLL